MPQAEVRKKQIRERRLTYSLVTYNYLGKHLNSLCSIGTPVFLVPTSSFCFFSEINTFFCISSLQNMASLHWALSLFVLLSTTCLSSAAPGPTTLQACSKIQSTLPGKLSLPGQSAYIKENRDYYNIGLAELGPACIAFPTSAQDVSAIIKILNSDAHKDVQFAVKSGGHSPNPGASSVKDGVLITMRHINGTVLDKEKRLAYIKPGGHWWDVMDVLKDSGHMVVAGRLGVVGIGGYLLQGGVSLLSGENGLGGDVRLTLFKPLLFSAEVRLI
jgi:FAD binding domain